MFVQPEIVISNAIQRRDCAKKEYQTEQDNTGKQNDKDGPIRWLMLTS